MKFTLQEVFTNTHPVIGMLHIDYLEGKRFKGIDHVIKSALKDLRSLQKGGVDGILIENWKEESLGEFVSPTTARNFTIVVKKILNKVKVPFGINVLNNDYKLAFSLAKDVKADFVELDVFVDKVQSDYQSNVNAIRHPFIINPTPREIWTYARSIGAQNIPLFVFIQPKHYKMLDKSKTIEDSTLQAITNGASAVLVTKATGFAPTASLIRRVKKVAGNTPVGIGSGFNADNAKQFFKVVDFAVAGTSLKLGGITDNPVDLNQVKKLMNVVKTSRV